MRARWSRWLDLLRTGFWFVPVVMLALTCGLALGLLHVDELVDPGIKASPAWAYSGDPEGARSLLSTIAGSMITAASVTFSLAAVALSLASQQYGSRVLRNFMRDRITQVLLGIFVATFLYCVLVVRAVRGTEVSGGFVPAISVTVGIALSIASLVLLVYFIHHISASIQASHILRVIAADMEGAIMKLYPSETGQPLEDSSVPRVLVERGRMPLSIKASGYLQVIDLEALLALAVEQDVTFELLIKPGDHLVAGTRIAIAWGVRELPQQALERVIRAFLLGGERTPAQDIRYQFQQVTDVVIRALSPGINDPFTAINGIDELTSGTAALARRSRVVEKRQDEHGVLRLIAPATTIGEVLQQTVGHIVIYAAGDRFVMARLRRLLDTVECDLRDAPERATLGWLRAELDRREQTKSVV